MISRIFRNPKTTVIGLILISFGGALVWFEKASLTEFSAFIMGGFALMMSKDGEATGNNKNQEVQKKTRTAHKKPKQKVDE
jgi:hypothetical protein